MYSPSCLHIFRMHHKTNGTHLFLPFTKPICILWHRRCKICPVLSSSEAARTQHFHFLPSLFFSFFFFPPQGQYEIIRQPSMLTFVWIYSWCSLEMPGNKSLLSHRPVALVPVHFSTPPAERERERRGKAGKRKRKNSLPSEVELVIWYSTLAPQSRSHRGQILFRFS